VPASNANALNLAIQGGGGVTFRQLLSRVRDGCIGAFRHNQLPFQSLVIELGVERNTAYNPVFQATFALQVGVF
jgi:non-ribosomal peptide synthetase component F